MGQKRKKEITAVEESDKVIFSLFQKAAENLSDLYTQRVSQQQHAFEAGQMSAYENMHEWIFAKLQQGEIITVQKILAYLQDKMNCIPSGSQQVGESRGEQPEPSSALTTPGEGNCPDVEMEIITDERSD